MPLIVNLRQLAEHSARLKGELPVAELDLDLRDDLIRAEKPLRYELEVQRLDNELLVQGRLVLPLHCKCVRCLKDFELPLRLEKWAQSLALSGEEKVPISGDSVDLTPYVREDILLEFPQHPLCETECRGLPTQTGKAKNSTKPGDSQKEPSAWTELDKLKF